MEKKMDQILAFEEPVNVNENIFRNEIWSAFARALNQKKNLILDFRNVNFIVSTVVPKLCCFGEIAKRSGIQVEIIPNTKLAIYLAEMGFWRIATQNGLFIFDERYLDFNLLDKKVTNALFCIEKEALKHKYIDTFEFADWADERTKYKYWIRAELTGISNTVGNGYYIVDNIPEQCRAVLKTVSGFVGYSEYTSEDTILGPIVELVHNAVWHSHGKCYFFVQTSRYKGEYGRIGIDISVSDTGCGLYKSLVDKYDNDSFKYYKKKDFEKLTDKVEQNYYSIVEALFFREQSETRGLYDIITDLSREPRKYFCELHLINGNIAVDLEEGQKRGKNGVILDKYDISNFVDNGISDILKKKKKYFSVMRDIDFSFCVDIGITIPL